MSNPEPPSVSRGPQARTPIVVPNAELPQPPAKQSTNASSSSPLPPLSPAPPPLSPATTPGGTLKPGRTSITGILKKPFSAFKKRVNTTKTGTLLLARHVQDILRDELLIDVKYKEAPVAVSRELRSLENLAEYHRWLRGILATFGFVAYVLALVIIETRDRRVSWFLLITSLLAEYCIVRIYVMKAQYVGLTNPVYGKHASLVNSPFFYQMIGEMGLWLVQTPPGLEAMYPYHMLNFIVFLRNYSLVMYLNNATFVYRTFCRAMSAMCGIPLSTSFFVRTQLIYNKLKSCTIMVTWCWLTLAMMFSKSEERSYADSMWFVFVTVGTIGYGDISPVTVTGRITAFLAWIFALVLLGYVVVLTHDTLSLQDHERNLYILFRSSEMAGTMKVESAKAIQAWWRFIMVKKKNQSAPLRNFYAWILMQQVANLREQRDSLRETARRFHEVTLDEKFSEAVRTLKAKNRTDMTSRSPSESLLSPKSSALLKNGGAGARESFSSPLMPNESSRLAKQPPPRRTSELVPKKESLVATSQAASAATAVVLSSQPRSGSVKSASGEEECVSEQRLQRLEQRTAVLASLLRQLANE